MTIIQRIDALVTWLFINTPGIIAAFMAFLAWKRSVQNAAQIDVVHRTINSNREKDMAMASSAGKAEGIMQERDAALVKADVKRDVVAEVRRLDEIH
jgi:hypothetical protein